MPTVRSAAVPGATGSGQCGGTELGARSFLQHCSPRAPPPAGLSTAALRRSAADELQLALLSPACSAVSRTCAKPLGARRTAGLVLSARRHRERNDRGPRVRPVAPANGQAASTGVTQSAPEVRPAPASRSAQPISVLARADHLFLFSPSLPLRLTQS